MVMREFTTATVAKAGGEPASVSEYYAVDVDMRDLDISKPTTWGVFTKDGRFTNLVGESEEDARYHGEEYFTADFVIRPLYEHPAPQKPIGGRDAEKDSFDNLRNKG